MTLPGAIAGIAALGSAHLFGQASDAATEAATDTGQYEPDRIE